MPGAKAILDLVVPTSGAAEAEPDEATRKMVAQVFRAFWNHEAPAFNLTREASLHSLWAAAASGDKNMPGRMREFLILCALRAREGTDPAELHQMAREFIPSVQLSQGGATTVSALDYVGATASMPLHIGLRLQETNQARLRLDPEQLRYMLLHHVKQLALAHEMPVAPDWIVKAYGAIVAQANRAFMAQGKRLEFARGKGLAPDRFPPCIQAFLGRVREGSSVSHHERFNLVAFLHYLGAPREEIIAHFQGSPGYDEATTAYQVDHIIGKPGESDQTGYRPMGCRQIRDLRICPDLACPGPTPLLRYESLLRQAGASSRRGAA